MSKNSSAEILASYSSDDMERLVETWTAGFPGTDASELHEFVPKIVHAERSEIIIARNLVGQLASAMVVNIDLGRDKLRGRIDDVATHPDSLRKGFGGIILDFSIDWFGKHGVSRVYLASSDEREPAHALYKSRGFYIHETNDFQLDL